MLGLFEFYVSTLGKSLVKIVKTLTIVAQRVLGIGVPHSFYCYLRLILDGPLEEAEKGYL